MNHDWSPTDAERDDALEKSIRHEKLQGEVSVPIQIGGWALLSNFILSSTIAAGFLASCSCAAEQSTCDLETPPKAAVADGVHGSYVFVFPWSLNPDYTGCQTIWDEHGRKVLVLEFKDGEPVQFRMAEATPGELTKICNYAAGHVQGEEADCPTYAEAKAPLRPREDFYLSVPPERDPRR